MVFHRYVGRYQVIIKFKNWIEHQFRETKFANFDKVHVFHVINFCTSFFLSSERASEWYTLHSKLLNRSQQYCCHFCFHTLSTDRQNLLLIGKKCVIVTVIPCSMISYSERTNQPQESPESDLGLGSLLIDWWSLFVPQRNIVWENKFWCWTLKIQTTISLLPKIETSVELTTRLLYIPMTTFVIQFTISFALLERSEENKILNRIEYLQVASLSLTYEKKKTHTFVLREINSNTRFYMSIKKNAPVCVNNNIFQRARLTWSQLLHRIHMIAGNMWMYYSYLWHSVQHLLQTTQWNLHKGFRKRFSLGN